MGTAERSGQDGDQDGQGSQVCPRYRDSLANERTFLAWVRTSLALTAGSVAVVQLVPPLPHTDLRWVAGGVLAALAGGTAVLAHTRWEATERAMRRGQPRPSPRGLGVVTVAVAVLALAALTLAVTARR